MSEIRRGMGYRSIYDIPVPDNIPAYLTSQGVPLNTPLMAGDTGRGPIPGRPLSSYILGGIPLSRHNDRYIERFLQRERLMTLYRLLKWYGYWDTPAAERRPLEEVLGLNPPREFDWGEFFGAPRASAPQPKHLPMGYGGDLVLKRGNINLNAITQEEFTNGEKVDVLYTEDQLKKLNRGETVNIKPSMIFKINSVDALLKQGSLQNPMTRENVALRERRTLRFGKSNNNSAAGAGAGASQGGKRKKRKTKTKRTRRS